MSATSTLGILARPGAVRRGKHPKILLGELVEVLQVLVHLHGLLDLLDFSLLLFLLLLLLLTKHESSDFLLLEGDTKAVSHALVDFLLAGA